VLSLSLVKLSDLDDLLVLRTPSGRSGGGGLGRASPSSLDAQPEVILLEHDRRSRSPAPREAEAGGLADVANHRRAEAGEACTAGTSDARID
jgi:hypothetical protein